MANPFDLISNELGIVNGTPERDFVSSVSAQRDMSPAVSAAADLLMGSPMQPAALSKARLQRGPPLTESPEKVERRRKREREAARRSRARKQSKVEDLEGRIAVLENENELLHEQLRWSNVADLVRQRDKLLQDLQGALDAGDADDATEKRIEDLVGAFNTLSEQISSANALAAESLSESGDRSHLAAVVLCIFAGADADGAVDPNVKAIGSKLSVQLRRDLGLDDTQFHQIVAARAKYVDQFRRAARDHQRALDLIENLEEHRAAIGHASNIIKAFRDLVLSKALTSAQQAKLILWLYRQQNLLQELAPSLVADAGD